MKAIKSTTLYCGILLSLCLSLLASCERWDDTEVNDQWKSKTISQILAANSQTTVFASIVEKAGYNDFLSGNKLVTVFAPVNDALKSVDMNNLDTLKAIVRNHIAYLSYTVTKGSFAVDSIEMINSKRLNVEGTSVDGINLASQPGSYNILASNGVVHLIDGVLQPKLNIWEYIQTQSGFNQASFIASLSQKVMDMQKSIQTGINADGKPIYDTVWVNNNTFLDECKLNDESSNRTFLLLTPDAQSALAAKYAKYFLRPTPAQQDSLIKSELIKDCILRRVDINSAGRYSSTGDVLVDIDPANISKTYHASNGIVYVVSAANIKMYENKIKTIVIEAEDYASTYSSNSAWSVRKKSNLSGGKDMMLNGRTTFTLTTTNPDNTSTTTSYYFDCFDAQGTISASATNPYWAQKSNCYIKFVQPLNSVGYKIYWAAYDDISWHYNGTYCPVPAQFAQKLLVGFPDDPVLTRKSASDATDGTIENNFSATTVFGTKGIVAGQYGEYPVNRYQASTATNLAGFYLLGDPYTESDSYGDFSVLKVPRYGKTTLMVANTTNGTGTYSGMIFLDYIKLVPQVDENE